MKIIKKVSSLVLLFVVLIGILSGCGSDTNKSQISSLADLVSATIGIITGTNYDNVAKEKFPNAERMYFSTSADVLLAVNQGKVDAYFADKVVVASMQWENQKVDYIDEPVEMISNALILAKEGYDPYLLAQLNEFIGNSKNNGTLERLEEKWVGDTEPSEHPDYTKLTGENGTLKIAVSDSLKPVSYKKGSMYTGYEVDFLTLFAEEYGYKLEIQGMAFDALIPSIASGKCDIGASAITITPERAESLTFTDPHFETYGVAIIRGENAAASSAKTLADFESAVIGVMNGSSFDLLASEYYPTAEKRYLNMPDLILNLQQEKINGILMDMGFYTPIIWEGESLSYIEMDMPATEYAVAFPKAAESEALMAQFNEFIRSETENGGLAELEAKWLSASEPDGSIDFTQLTGENGTLHVATTVESKPFSYLKDGKYYGYDADFLFRFAKEYGYALRIDQIDFGALLPGLTAGRFDLAVSGITVTEERRETVLFSDAYYRSPIVMAVLADEPAKGGEKTLADFENATIGVMTGTVYDDFAKERFPNAKREYYNMISDMIVAVEQEKIDGYLSESTYVTAAIWEGAKIQSIDEAIDHTQAAYIFQKSEQSAQLREQLNSFIHAAKENGTLDELAEKWFGKTEPAGKLDFDALTGENGTIRIAVAPDLKPISYIKDGELTGYEMEILLLFAKEYGYKLDMSYMTFDAILPGVTTGKYDIGTGAVTITEERAQSVDFSESHLTVDVVMVVKDESDILAHSSFWNELKEDFNKTFIRENRWKLIVEGIGVTMVISILAILIGSLLGFALYMLSRSDIKILRGLIKGISKVYSRFIAGTPVVVILMILFYVVFGNIRDMSGIVVAILGFSLVFGAFVYEHMQISVDSVDNGQTEAAYALGYNKNNTFFRIVLPQAMKIFLPSYCGQIVELIKATAVVGYIAVNDLTKMGDIIRSNTYEAFFPLIATAVIYFILTWIVASLLKIIKFKFEPKRRTEKTILKGVKR